MELPLCSLTATPSKDELKVLKGIIKDVNLEFNLDLDLSAIWCLIAAFNYGRSRGREELSRELIDKESQERS